MASRTVSHVFADSSQTGNLREIFQKSSCLQEPVGMAKIASIRIHADLPPFVFDDMSGRKTMLMGHLEIHVMETYANFRLWDIRLLMQITKKNSSWRRCSTCTTRSIVLHQWQTMATPNTLDNGTYRYPFGCLLSNNLPPTAFGDTASLEYILLATASNPSGEEITCKQHLEIKQIGYPRGIRVTKCLFLPSSLVASVAVPRFVSASDNFSFTVHMTGLLEDHLDSQRIWNLRHLDWRVEEIQSLNAFPCSRHGFKAGQQEESKIRERMRIIARGSVTSGWETDHEHGSIDLNIQGTYVQGLVPLCDMQLDGCIQVSHVLRLRMIIIEELSPTQQCKKKLATGLSRTMRTEVPIVLIQNHMPYNAWEDDERLPSYGDATSAAPLYES